MNIGIGESDFASWKHHPVSKVFLKFLADKRSFLERTALGEWIAGNLSLQMDQTIRGQIIELFEIENASFEQMKAFYEEQQEENETQAN